LKEQPGTQSPVKLTWTEKMSVLSTFLESSLNFLSNDLKKDYKNKSGKREKSGVKS